MSQEIIDIAINYKRKVAGAFQSITVDDINSKIAGIELIVTTKIDGEYNLLCFDGIRSVLVNNGGKIKSELPILDEITEILKSKNVSSLKAIVELHTKSSDRCRVFDVMKALSDDTSQLTISAFDIVELNSEKYNEDDYTKKLSKLDELLDGKVVEQKILSKS